MFYVNLRMFYGLRCIGKGLEAGKMFCGLMNLSPPTTSRTIYTNLLRDSLANVAEQSMKKATLEAVEENENSSDIAIAFDGTWQKRGFSSKNGCFTVTSVDTGKVVDSEVLTKYCSSCEKLKGKPNKQVKHNEICQQNYAGSSGGMETVAAVALCGRSLAKRGVRYLKFLGDGDSSSYSSVVASQPYGDTPIEKLECIGHIQKRMGSRLRKLKNTLKATPLSDGKPIKGAGRLTDNIIDKIQCYFGNAIRANTTSLEKMKSAVWATFHHMGATDENPRHELCPPPPDTWCPYRKAMAENKPYVHKKSLPMAILEAIKPTFQALSKPDLLKKCLHGKTQNVNESFNNVVWSRVPKNTFVGRKTLELGVFDAIVTFNDGNIQRLQVLRDLGINDYGMNTVAALKRADEERLRRAELAAMEATKEARTTKRRLRLNEDEDGGDHYSPGGF